MDSDKRTHLLPFKERAAENGLFPILAITCALLASYLIVTVFELQKNFMFKVGMPSPALITADQDLSIEDDAATAALKAKARENVAPLLQFDPDAKVRTSKNISDLLNNVALLKDTNLSDEQKVQRMKDLYGVLFTDTSYRSLLALTPEELAAVRTSSEQVVEEAMNSQVLADVLEVKKNDIAQSLSADTTLSGSARAVLTDVIKVFLEPNYLIDTEGTEELKDRAADSVEPVTIRVSAGETVIDKGDRVSARSALILEELGVIGQGLPLREHLGNLLVLMSIFLFIFYFLRTFEPKLLSDKDRIVPLLGIVVGNLAIGAVVIQASELYLVPVAAGAMIAAVLFNLRTALVVGVSTVMAVCLIGSADFPVFFTFILGTFVSVVLARLVKERTQMSMNVFFTAVVFFGLAFSSNMATDQLFSEAVELSIWASAGGLLSAVITLGVLPLLEAGFNFSTDLRMLDFANLNNPLLRELSTKAPGTYNHSIIVGNMAEMAAQRIGGNPVLAKVGGYYHDIGKISRPLFFIENQRSMQNPHDTTRPKMSYLIINSHVKDGVDLGKQYKMPDEVLAIVNEHHGTSLIRYFYTKAKEEASTQAGGKFSPVESDFRYDTEKPHSKEAALVMLADAAEAAARTLPKHSAVKLDALVKKVINGISEDGQLDESRLCLAELSVICDVYKDFLLSHYHERVVYPERTVVGA